MWINLFSLLFVTTGGGVGGEEDFVVTMAPQWQHRLIMKGRW